METTATIESLKTVVTYCFTICGEVVSTIAEQPLLLLPVGIMMAGGGIGLAKRLIGR